MPSGELLAVEAVILHARATDHLESLLAQLQPEMPRRRVPQN
jgi:hypothetical protein